MAKELTTTQSGNVYRTVPSFQAIGAVVISATVLGTNVVATLYFSPDNETTWVAMKPDIVLSGTMNHIKVDTAPGYHYRIDVSGGANDNVRRDVKLWVSDYATNSYAILPIR